MLTADTPIAVYIMASGRNGTLYIGVTSNLEARVLQHKRAAQPGFTRDYNCRRLVWFEPHGQMSEAIQREKKLKHWKRDWKLQLIEAANPDWRDLSDGDGGRKAEALRAGRLGPRFRRPLRGQRPKDDDPS